MTEQDLLQRFIFENAPVRGEYIHLQESFQTIADQHQYPPSVRQLLGEALCVAGLLSAIIKFKGRLSVQFRGKGKLKLLMAQCDNNLHVRGLAKWEGMLSYEELMESFNQGVLIIMLDSGGGKAPYQGIVSWRGNSLVESIEGYFRDSEQLSTKIRLSVDQNSASGFLLQIIPGSERNSAIIEQEIINPHWEHIAKQAENLTQHDLLHLDYQTLLGKIFPQDEIRVFPSTPVKFQCTCSRKRGSDAIMILGREEAEAELKDKQTIVVTCDFCNKEYIYDRVDVAKIFEDNNGPDSNKQLH